MESWRPKPIAGVCFLETEEARYAQRASLFKGKEMAPSPTTLARLSSALA